MKTYFTMTRIVSLCHLMVIELFLRHVQVLLFVPDTGNVKSNYPLVMPVQYTIDSSGHTAVYVPILQMLQTMFKNTDLLDKIQEAKPSPPGMYMSHEDGTYFNEIQLLSEAGELKLSLILYECMWMTLN